MVMRLPRAIREKKKPAKSGSLPRSSIKSDYKSSIGPAGPIPYHALILSAQS